MGDGRAEGLSAIGDGRKAAISLTPNIVGIHIHIFESSQFEGLYVGYLLYHEILSYSNWDSYVTSSFLRKESLYIVHLDRVKSFDVSTVSGFT